MHRLLCILGAVLLAAHAFAAPAATRNWVPCLSTIKGYGFCEETLFWAGQSYPHQQIVNQQQPIHHPSYPAEHIYRPSYPQQPIFNPSHQQHLSDYQQQIYIPNYHLPEYHIPTVETNPGGTDHIVVILSSSEETQAAASNSSEINALFDRLFTIMEDVRRENHKIEEERKTREPSFDYSQINDAFNKINQVTQKAAKLVFETAYLQQKLKDNNTPEVPHYDQIDQIVGNIEKASKNISNAIAKLKQSHEKCSRGDEHCKSEQKCSPEEHCESEHKEHEVAKCSPGDEHCKSEQIVDKCSAEGNCKPDEKVDQTSTPGETVDAIEETKSEALNGTVPETVSKEIDIISKEIHETDSQVEDALEKLEPEKSIEETVKSITEILDDISKQPPKETTPVERDPSRLKKGISELDNAALINRLIEDVHDLTREGIDNLETVIATELSDADREKAFDDLVKTKYTNDETTSAEVIALGDQLASFGTKAKDLIQKKVTPEDLSRTIEDSPETDLAEKYEEVSKEDVESIKDIINNLSASGVPMNKIQDLADHLDDFDKEKKNVIAEAKGIDESTLENILVEKQVREELSDFGKILDELYGKGISQELINNLDKKVSYLKDYSITEILGTLESRRSKREVDDETNVYAELYDLLVEIINTNFEDASVDAFVAKVDELSSSNVAKATIFDTTVEVVTDIVDKKDRPKRAVKGVVEIPKNEMYDAVEQVYMANFTDASIEALFEKVDHLVRKGVAPSQILGETLTDVFLLMLKESQTLPVYGKSKNLELLSLIENAVTSDASEESMAAYYKKLDQLMLEGADPLQLQIDVMVDLFTVLRSKEKRPKRDQRPIVSHKDLLGRLFSIHDKLLGPIKDFVTKRDFTTDKDREQQLDFLRQTKKITSKWIQHTFEQIMALDEASAAALDEVSNASVNAASTASADAALNASVEAPSDSSIPTTTPISTH